MNKINKLNNIFRVLFIEVNGNLVLGTDYTDYMDSLKGYEMSRQARHDRHHSFKEICLIRVIRA